MLELDAPLWLVALAALPALRWLHRFRAADHVHVTSALFLWRGVSEEVAGVRRALPPDPVWRLRATALAAGVLALAGPHWTVVGAPALVVWVDDSLSLQTLEGPATRAELAAEALLQALRARPGTAPVTLRSLSDPAAALALPTPADPAALARWLTRVPGEPRPPAPATLAADAEHWLVSDGADAGLAAWLARAPVTRVIQVGAEGENAAVTALGVRPALDGSGTLLGTVSAEHLGRQPGTRELTVTAGGATLARWPVTLTPGTPTRRDFQLPAGSQGRVQARLEPADALAGDDALELTLPARPLATRIAGECGAHLRAAIAAHPGLAVTPAGGSPALTVACGPGVVEPEGPQLRVHTTPGAAAGPGAGRLLATGPLAELDLDPLWLRAVAGPVPDGAAVLLELDGRPAITAGPGRRVDVLLDLERPELSGVPQYPALLAALLDQLAGTDLVAGVSATRRDPSASRVRPEPLAAAPQALAGGVPAALDLGPWLIGAALLLVAADLVRTARRTLVPRRLADPAAGEARA